MRDYNSLLSDYLTANSIFVAAIGFLLARQPNTLLLVTLVVILCSFGILMALQMAIVLGRYSARRPYGNGGFEVPSEARAGHSRNSLLTSIGCGTSMKPLRIKIMIHQAYRPTGLHVNIGSGGRAVRLVFRCFLALRMYSFSSGDSKNSCASARL